MAIQDKHPSDIAEQISNMEDKEQILAFLLLKPQQKSDVFSYLDKATQENIITSIGKDGLAEILENMAPDDRTKLFEDFPDNIIKNITNLLSDEERKIALSLIGYPEDAVGRMMTPYYIQAKKSWTVEKTLKHIKKVGRKADTLNFVYVVDANQKLIDDIPIGKILLADENTTLGELGDDSYINLFANNSKEEAIPVFDKYDRTVLPVTTDSGVLVGIVTVDDILEVIEARDTEDIQKFGGLESLDFPYAETSLKKLIGKRAGWLILLFLGEMLTASAMGYFEDEIAQAVVLALFIPLIISSGGNSGSQAATLIIRAMALQEINLRSWWFVLRRELFSGFMLGAILGIIGFLRIWIWQKAGIYDYGAHWYLIGITIFASLIGVVLWGTIAGAMIPFILRSFKLDPATSSAPFVATLVDVTGLVIYFSIAAVFLKGILLS
ncbi:magnesium transporter [Aureivirga sp. CE67]|uniref:magnesium transporter n=1 Tax=Aureivirga sp. CE67 TaxID=1788983 RepID=UPI0018C990EB|nr:magnesium transporter [Aureivirga sp. CE67]